MNSRPTYARLERRLLIILGRYGAVLAEGLPGGEAQVTGSPGAVTRELLADALAFAHTRLLREVKAQHLGGEVTSLGVTSSTLTAPAGAASVDPAREVIPLLDRAPALGRILFILRCCVAEGDPRTLGASLPEMVSPRQVRFLRSTGQVKHAAYPVAYREGRNLVVEPGLDERGQVAVETYYVKGTAPDYLAPASWLRARLDRRLEAALLWEAAAYCWRKLDRRELAGLCASIAADERLVFERRTRIADAAGRTMYDDEVDVEHEA